MFRELPSPYWAQGFGLENLVESLVHTRGGAQADPTEQVTFRRGRRSTWERTFPAKGWECRTVVVISTLAMARVVSIARVWAARPGGLGA
eukprot:6273588-Amphidinium_carterae.1